LYAVGLSFALGRAGHWSQPKPGREDPTSSGSIRRVLVVGASGRTGRELVHQAIERGYQVRAMVRKPERFDIRHDRLQVAVADILDEESVERASDGCDAVLCALGHGRFLGPSTVLSEGTRHIVRAMQKSGARRLVCETSLGIGDSAFRMGLYYTFFVIPVILPFYYWDKTRQERLISRSDVEWVIVRPAVLTSGKRSGRIQHGFGVGSLLLTRRISRADVAFFMLDQLDTDKYLGTAPGCQRARSAA